MDSGAWQTIISLLIGGGGVAFVTALAKGIRDLRGGARAREREAVDDLARWRDEADEGRRAAERDRDFWRGTAGSYGYQLRTLGVEPIPANPIPPSERPQTRQSPP